MLDAMLRIKKKKNTSVLLKSAQLRSRHLTHSSGCRRQARSLLCCGSSGSELWPQTVSYYNSTTRNIGCDDVASKQLLGWRTEIILQRVRVKVGDTSRTLLDGDQIRFFFLTVFRPGMRKPGFVLKAYGS